MDDTLIKNTQLESGANSSQVPARKTKSVSRKKRRAPRRKLYRDGKISDAKFTKILWHFVRDDSATDTARAVSLSVQSVLAIFRKIRVYFFEAGLFMDFYAGQDPLDYVSDNPVFEKALLEFHFARGKAKNGLRQPVSEPPYHFAESCWRYDFKVIAEERNSPHVHDMMLAHLLEIIRVCGPVDKKPTNRSVGVQAVLRQYEQRVTWLMRNSPHFANDEHHPELLSADQRNNC